MKKMTKAILCLLGVWGVTWAQSQEYIEKKYADFDKEIAKVETAANQNSADSTAVKTVGETVEENSEEISVQDAEITAENMAAEESAVEATTVPETLADENAVPSEEIAESQEQAESDIEDETSDVAQNDQFEEKEELSAADADTLAVVHLPEGDSIAQETLDFSAWVNPACRPVPTTSEYKIRRGRLHRGIDVKIYTGDSIVAVAPGKVIVSRYNRGGYGHYIILQHENGTQTVYGHLSKRLKKVGEMAERGELIGKGGNTGRSTGSHLHFEIRYGDINIDPSTVINFSEGTLVSNADKFSIAEATASHKAIQKELSRHRVHRIRKGDTLGKLARRYGTTIERICKLNKIKRNSILRIGRLIQIS